MSLTGIIFGQGITIGHGITAGTPSAPIAGTYTVGINANETSYSLNLPANVTGSYTSVTIVSQSGSGTATVSGRDILYAGSASSGGHNTLNITYTVTGPGGTSASGAITVNNGCCVVATALTQQGFWSARQYQAINIWGAEHLDQTVLGRALHRGYHMVAPKVIVPALQKPDTLTARYFRWSFDNATGMLRGRRYSKLSVVNSALWISALTVVGMFVSSRQAEHSWKKSYTKDSK